MIQTRICMIHTETKRCVHTQHYNFSSWMPNYHEAFNSMVIDLEFESRSDFVELNHQPWQFKLTSQEAQLEFVEVGDLDKATLGLLQVQTERCRVFQTVHSWIRTYRERQSRKQFGQDQANEMKLRMALDWLEGRPNSFIPALAEIEGLSTVNCAELIVAMAAHWDEVLAHTELVWAHMKKLLLAANTRDDVYHVRDVVWAKYFTRL